MAAASKSSRRLKTMRPILEEEFHHDGRGPELQRVIWGRSTPLAFEYFNPEDEYTDDEIKHIRLVDVGAFASAGEEVHGGMVTTPGSKAAIHDCGQSDWLRSFNPQHLASCSHFQIMFYDEIFDVICREILPGAGTYPDET